MSMWFSIPVIYLFVFSQYFGVFFWGEGGHNCMKYPRYHCVMDFYSSRGMVHKLFFFAPCLEAFHHFYPW